MAGRGGWRADWTGAGYEEREGERQDGSGKGRFLTRSTPCKPLSILGVTAGQAGNGGFGKGQRERPATRRGGGQGSKIEIVAKSNSHGCHTRQKFSARPRHPAIREAFQIGKSLVINPPKIFDENSVREAPIAPQDLSIYYMSSFPLKTFS